MEDLLKFEDVQSANLEDLLVMKFGKKTASLANPAGFELCNGMLLACKMAMKHEGVSAKTWMEFAQLNVASRFMGPAHRGFRRSQQQPNVHRYDVQYQGALVILVFTPWKGSEKLTVKFHYSDAFKIYRITRDACRDAKRWAGDGSRIWNGRAALRNATPD
jgi:hypothetical protein